MFLEFNTTLSGGTTITLPLMDAVDVIVNWGDETQSEISAQGLYQHTYLEEGEYTVSIGGSLQRFGIGNKYDHAEKLTRVTSFGNLGLTSLAGAFWGAVNLIEVPAVLPGSVTSLSSIFLGASSFNQDIGAWDVSNVTNMFQMFWEASSFNQYIGDWNVGSVTNLSGMFAEAPAFNQNLSRWCVQHILSKPDNFDTGANAWVLPQPGWGACPVAVDVPESRTVDDTGAVSGETLCFDALKTITVSNFVAASGGSASLIAGESISLLPGTIVEAGGYLHAFITTDGTFCGGIEKHFLEPEELFELAETVKEESLEAELPTELPGDLPFRVYPNPTPGLFTLELSGYDQDAKIVVDVYGLRGETILRKELSAAQQLHTLSIEGSLPGMYFIRVLSGSQSGVQRIIKR